MLRLYSYHESGNAYKVRLLLTQLALAFESIECDILEGETRTDDFLRKNPNGRIPLLEWPDGRRLAESNAILFHLAEGTSFGFEDAFRRAQMLQWMCFEQYSHEPYIAVVRFWCFAGWAEEKRDEIPERMSRGYDALDVMEGHLAQCDYFVGGRYSVADISLYAYTHVAGEGGFDIARYPAIRAWLERVAEQPRHIAMKSGTD